MLILTSATIESDDPAAEISLDNLDANGNYRITHTGEDLTVAARDERGRWRPVDRFTKATRVDPKGKANTWVFQGISHKLVADVRMAPEDSVVKFSAKGQDGCPTCH